MIYQVIKKNITLELLGLIVAMLVFTGCAHKIILPGNALDPAKQQLTIIHFNDGESHLLNAGAGREDYGGIARFTTIIKDIRSDIKTRRPSATELTLSAGNNILAGPIFNVSLQKGPPYYDGIALDIIGLDASALGNHEFDFGPEVLSNFIKSFNYIKPLFLAANLDMSREPELLTLQDAGKIAGYSILEKNGEKFGVIGLTTPDLKTISSPRNVIVQKNLVEIVQHAVDSLEEAGVNKIILLSHLQCINNEMALIKKVHGLDVVITGGGGELLCGHRHSSTQDIMPDEAPAIGSYPLYVKDPDNRNVPIVTTPGDYCYVGRLDLSFDSAGEIAEVLPSSRIFRVIGDNLRGSVEPDRIITETVVIPVAKTITTATKILGNSKVCLDGKRENTGSRETNFGDLVADAIFWSAAKHADSFNIGQPTVAILNGGAIRQSIPAGTISDAALFAACPFYDFITMVKDVPPKTFKALIESTLSRLKVEDTASGLKRESSGFPQISRMSIIYNPTRSVGQRVKQIKLSNGDLIVSNYKIVQYAPNVNIATLNFLTNGGDSWEFGDGGKTNIGVPLQSALIDYISAPDANGGLNKLISKKRYPNGGLNRIMLTRE